MKKQKSYLNHQDILDHSKNPRNYGIFESSDFVSSKQNPLCGDSVVLCGVVSNKKLKSLRFEGKGCVLSLAMASKLTEYVQGMSLKEVLALDESTVSKLLGMSLGPNRLQCGLLPIIALHKGIELYQKSKNETANT